MKKLKIKSMLLAFVLPLCTGAFVPAVGAYSNLDNVKAEDNIFEVKNSHEFLIALNKSKENDTIAVQQDILLDNVLSIDHSLNIDLCGHKIIVGHNGKIVIGSKKFSHTDINTVTIPGYYTYENKYKHISHGNVRRRNSDVTKSVVIGDYDRETTLVPVWHPPVVKTEYYSVYDYHDNIDVMIKNGEIIKSDGRNGKDGLRESGLCSTKHNAQKGETPCAPLKVISGFLRLENVVVRGGDGGNGGNGGYKSLLHIPLIFLGGGHGGNGGKGGNGGYAIEFDRNKNNTVVLTGTSRLKSGKGGLGGKKGYANPNYWLIPGFSGTNGANGERLKTTNLDTDY